MTPEELKAFRERSGWTQTQLAGILNDALDRRYDSSAVGRWERAGKPIPSAVQAFLFAAADGELDLEPPVPSEPRGRRADSAPSPDGPPMPSALMSSGAYAAVCEQFFELIATGLGMIGVALNSAPLRADGLTILEDKQKLGAAYGKLAETNETFRNMLMATDKQGAYLAVALATGTTAGRLWRNHSVPAAAPIVSADEQLAADVAEPHAAEG